MPAYAQPTEPQSIPAEPLIAYIPASFDGYLHVPVADALTGLSNMRLLAVVASFIQPTRVTAPSQPTYDTFFPLTRFNDASFDEIVLPWLSGDIVAAYRHLEVPLSASQDEILLILPTRDPFLGAGTVTELLGSPVATSRQVGSAVIYDGEHASVALTGAAILIGSPDLIDEAASVTAPDAPAGARLIDDPTYRAVMGGLSNDQTALTAYLHGTAASAAVPFLLSQQSDQAQPLLQLFAQALEAENAAAPLNARLLDGRVDAVGVAANLSLNQAGLLVDSSAAARVHFAETVQPSTSAPAETTTPYFDWVPQNALLVLSGTSASELAHEALTGLPLYNLSGIALNAFPAAISAGAQSDAVSAPTLDQLQASVSGFLSAMQETARVDLQTDGLDRLNGGYVLALLPRPNNPTPLLNTPYDAFVVTSANRPSIVVNTLVNALKAFMGENAVTETPIGGESFWTVSDPVGATVFQIGVSDGLLVMGTGDSVAAALQAHAGANRLIDTSLWINALENGVPPALYVDANAFYTTFLSQALGGGSGGVPVDFVRASSAVDSAGIYELRVRVQIHQ
ncbi:MAG: DUF3352 domain-containing protein [Anaerolineae bacterium]